MDKQAELRRMQTIALGCLALAAGLLLLASLMPAGFASGLLKAFAEAALVGGLADWFAVVALFRRPLGLPIPHTAIIPANKDRIADNLAAFVKDKFLGPDALGELIQRSDPVLRIAQWLHDPANSRRLGRFAASLVSHGLEMVEDRHIQAFIGKAARAGLGRIDLTQNLADLLEILTREGRHHPLLDEVIRQLADYMKQDEVRAMLAARVVAWLKEEHSVKEKVLPSEWIGKRTASAVEQILERLAADLAASPEHELRAAVDKAVVRFIERLRSDESFHRRGEQLRQQILQNPDFLAFINGLWADLRQWLAEDLARQPGEAVLAGNAEAMGRWLGRHLLDDAELRASLSEHLMRMGRDLAPAFAQHLVDHIRSTVRNWEAADMSRQLELQIGRDLQFIRINGTVVGGLVGAVLFLLAHGAELRGFFPAF